MSALREERSWVDFPVGVRGLLPLVELGHSFGHRGEHVVAHWRELLRVRHGEPPSDHPQKGARKAEDSREPGGGTGGKSSGGAVAS